MTIKYFASSSTVTSGRPSVTILLLPNINCVVFSVLCPLIAIKCSLVITQLLENRRFNTVIQRGALKCVSASTHEVTVILHH